MKLIYFYIAALMLGAAYTHASDNPVEVTGERVPGYDFSRNAVYVTILGTSIPAAVNYERILTQFRWVNVAPKIGGFYSKFSKYNDLTIANACVEVNTLVGHKCHLGVLGIGWAGYYGSYYSDTDDKTKHYGIPVTTGSVYYRFQNPTPGIFFQFGFTTTTIIALASNDLVQMVIANAAIYGLDKVFGKKVIFTVPSISIGYSF